MLSTRLIRVRMEHRPLLPGEGEKRCSTCGEVKPLEEFNKLKKAKDGRQWNCRDCNKANHYKDWDRHMAQIRARRARRIAENRVWLIEYLEVHPCVDCGEADIVVLEFDHLRDKHSNVSRLVLGGFEWAKVVAEIAKCEVVCANCHTRRTAERGRTYRWRHVHGEAD